MQIACLMHVPFEGPAAIADWAVERGHALRTIRLFEGQSPPTLETFDLLAVMGGPMGVGDKAEYPWLAAEKRFLEQVLNAGKCILGVCLGAQLLADVLGATVWPNAHKEIGWHEVRLTAAGRQSTLLADWPERFMAFHWHGDTFNLPAGAVHLATSRACPHQAFACENKAIGLQFHVEYTADSIEQMIAHCSHELTDGPFIQPIGQLRAGSRHIAANRRLLASLLAAVERAADARPPD